MSEQEKKNAVETQFVDEEPKDENKGENTALDGGAVNPAGDGKKDEEKPKKEWVPIRVAKAIGRGIGKAHRAVEDFMDRHPKTARVMAFAAGAGATYGATKLYSKWTDAHRPVATEPAKNDELDMTDEVEYLPDPELEPEEFKDEVEMEEPAEDIAEEKIDDVV